VVQLVRATDLKGYYEHIIVAIACVVMLAWPCYNHAQSVISTGPFTGTYSESFESFPDYYHSDPALLPESTSIMGGFASITSANHDMVVYNTSDGASWGLGLIMAGTSDGLQGLGLNSTGDTLTIDFNSPVTAFGGYFAADGYDGMSPLLTFNFSDGSSGNYYYNDPNGTLDWEGWESSAGINSVTISGNFMAMDGLQAAVPEPTTLALFGLAGSVALAATRYRKSRNGKNYNHR
jgi:hypothetical protein